MNLSIPRGLVVGIGVAQVLTFGFIFVPRFLSDAVVLSTPFVAAFAGDLLLSTALLLAEVVMLLLTFRRNVAISMLYFVIATVEISYVCYILFAGF